MKNNSLYFLLLLIIFTIYPNYLSADIGPKPTMRFEIQYENFENISLQKGQLMLCKDKFCEQSNPLTRVGPQYFECNDNFCNSRSYGYSTYLKLVLDFSDRIRESQVFSATEFDAEFRVQVLESKLIVKEQMPVASGDNIIVFFIIAFLLTITFELFVVLIDVIKYKLNKKILLYVLAANSISLPIVWFVFPLIKISSFLYILVLSEVFAVIFEASFIYIFNKNSITFKRSLILSMIMNLISLFIGGYIYALIIP